MSERRRTGLQLDDGTVVDAWQDGDVFYDAPVGGKVIWSPAAKKAEDEE